MPMNNPHSEFIETRQQQMAALVDLYQALGGGWQS